MHEPEGIEYRVVVNHEEQYSIWPTQKPNPLGWTDTGTLGSKRACLEWIASNWKDMRPLSLRGAPSQSAPLLAATSPVAAAPRQPSLVETLCAGPQVVRLNRVANAEALREDLDRGYALLEFTGTAGGTEVGCRVTRAHDGSKNVEFDTKLHVARFVSRVTLDGYALQVRAEVSLSTLEGKAEVTLESAGT